MMCSDDVAAMAAVPTGSAAAADAVGDACDPERALAYRRSLRASRVRRATAALRRRRLLRSRGSVLAAVAGLLVASGGAVAQDAGPPAAGAAVGSATIAAAQAALGVEADGIVGPRTRRATKRFQRRNGLAADGVIGSATLAALGIDAGGDARSARASAAAPLDPVLQRVAVCESGGEPTAVSADGTYRGKYQFSSETWRAVGGRGDPARASEAEQDRRAAKLLARAGTSPWPNCA